MILKRNNELVAIGLLRDGDTYIAAARTFGPRRTSTYEASEATVSKSEAVEAALDHAQALMPCGWEPLYDTTILGQILQALDPYAGMIALPQRDIAGVIASHRKALQAEAEARQAKAEAEAAEVQAKAKAAAEVMEAQAAQAKAVIEAATKDLIGVASGTSLGVAEAAIYGHVKTTASAPLSPVRKPIRTDEAAGKEKIRQTHPEYTESQVDAAYDLGLRASTLDLED